MKRFVSVFAIFFVILILGCEKEKKTETKTETKTPPVINDFVLDGVLNNAAKFAISVEPGDLPLRETGICWDSVSNPTIKGNNFKSAELAIGFAHYYKCLVSGLKLESQYYSRAYAINAMDTVYSNKQIPFQTDNIVDTFKYTATVKFKGWDCYETYVIWLMSYDDSTKLKDGSYYADELSAEFKISELKILLNCREPNANEEYFCTFLGPTFPHLIVTSCRKAQDDNLK